MDVSGLEPTFQIVDIFTPYGFLRDSIPLPGDVVQSMADSIQTLKESYKPTILLGPPTSLTFDVDEGRGFSLAQTSTVTNSGVFGSLLDASLSSSAPYVDVSPAVVGGLAPNQYGNFDVAVDSTSLLTSGSPYHATITVQDPRATNTVQTLPVTINVRPKAVIGTSTALVIFTAARPLSGPFPPISDMSFMVTNTGPSGSVLDFQIARLTGLSQNWLSGFTPSSGTLGAAQNQNITVSVAPVEGLYLGTYEETLRISGYSANDYTDVLIRLVIT